MVLCGPPAVGKGALAELLVQRHPEAFGRTVSHTTRRPKARLPCPALHTLSRPANSCHAAGQKPVVSAAAFTLLPPYWQQGRLSSCHGASPPAALLQEHELQGRTYTFTDPASMQAEIDAGNFLEACQVQHGAEAHLYGSSLVTVRGVASTGMAVHLSGPVLPCRLLRGAVQKAALDRLRQAQCSSRCAVLHW